ncbi:avidin/streptavidin family protein [Parendozoicomonas haliclonae]|uniref:Avidin family protein n=1 Tax=Parendozoicomonas haliclonae TaxID=1960125 RepID=A0A1X7ARM5_9GAMM|nr:avidin/streptavidin family protein [Parendozoicomonas haliclonae]SMA50057.1 Avidin family protein [Parendozoicomonas haliclonae]
MQRFLRRVSLLLVVATLLLPALSSADDADRFAGTWRNQRGSVLALSKQDRDNLKGTFATAVASTRDCIGYKAPLNAAINGNAIALSLTMKGCGSPYVVAMTGTLHKDKDQKETLVMQALIQSKGEDHWNSRIQTTDYYYRQGSQ